MHKFVYIKSMILFFVSLIFIIRSYDKCIAQVLKGQDDRNKVLIDACIVENLDNLDKEVRRDEFAKMIVKSSTYRDFVPASIDTAICNDVDIQNEYAVYIKTAIDNKLMFTYLGGFFKPDEYTSYNDLTRGCLALLSYEDNDFTGNKVKARNSKFEDLELDENISAEKEKHITKQDIMNAIYNTLKHNIKSDSIALYEKVFPKMYKDSDGELNSIGLLNTTIKGPYIAKSGIDAKEIVIPFDYKKNPIYINGVLSDEKILNDDLVNSGYILYYYDENRKITYAYSVRDDIQTTIATSIGYVNEIKYNAKDMLIPSYVIIDGKKYIFGNEESKLKFSYSGSIKTDDKIIFIYNKMLDVIGNDEEDAGMKTKGRIVNAFIYDLVY